MNKAFTLADVAFLTSERGQNLIDLMSGEDLSEASLLNLIPKLRSQYTVDETSAAVETLRLRTKAIDKFGGDAELMLFTGDALEQSSDPRVRAYRASVTVGANVTDACCGIGADSIAFARAGKHVVGVDIDPVRVMMAGYNSNVLQLPLTFHAADVRSDPMPESDVIFFDPARRDHLGNRLKDVEAYIPPLSLIRRWPVPVIAKLSPGVDLAQLQGYHPGLSTPPVHFVSVNGDLKECIFFYDPANQDAYEITAVVITVDGQVYRYSRERDVNYIVPLTEDPSGWLNEPDPAVIRAGYVEDIAALSSGKMLDPSIAYYVSDEPHAGVWARSWKILDWMPFHLKRLRGYLRERGVGLVTIKKRGSPIEPQELMRRLKLKGDVSLTLVLTRLRGEAVVIICEDFQP